MEYLKVWTSFKELIKTLNFDEIGRLFVMMLNYAETGVEPQDFAGNERFLWPVARQDIDRTAQKNEVLRVNGLKGGRPRTNDNQEKPNVTKENQSEANESLNIKKSNIKKSNKETLLTECKEIRRFTPPTVDEVAAYCRERHNSVDPQTFVDFYSSKGWKVGNSPMKDWKACVRTWERNRTTTQKVVNAQKYTQRDYSGQQDEAMRRMMEQMGGSG